VAEHPEQVLPQNRSPPPEGNEKCVPKNGSNINSTSAT